MPSQTNAPSILAEQNGLYGFQRVTDTDAPEREFAFVKAMNGDVTFDANCSVAKGDAPSSGDVLQQGDVLAGPFTQVGIQAGGGVLYAYFRSTDRP